MRIFVLLFAVCFTLNSSAQLIPHLDKITELWGYQNDAGEIVIEHQFYKAFNFSEGLAAVMDCQFEYDATQEYIISSTCKSWFIDDQGVKRLDIPSNMTPLNSIFYPAHQFEFHDGLVGLMDQVSGKWGFIDTSGNVIIPNRYDVVGDFSEGKVFAAILTNTFMEFVGKNKVGYIDRSGHWVFKLDQELANLKNGCFFFGSKFKEGITEMNIVENDGDCVNWGFIVVNEKGQVIEKVFK